MSGETCVYTKAKESRWSGYGTDWKSACGHSVRCEAPIDVGFSSAPLPNEDGKFCHYCGKVIELKAQP